MQRQLARRVLVAAIVGGAPVAAFTAQSGSAPAHAVGACTWYGVGVDHDPGWTEGPCTTTPTALGNYDACASAVEIRSTATSVPTGQHTVYVGVAACVPAPGS